MKTQGFVPLWLARLRSVVRRILSPWSSLRARLPFQNLQVEVVQRKAFARASFKICELKMWKRSFQCEFPSKPASWSCAMESFVRDFLQNLQVEDVKTKLSCEFPSKSASWSCAMEAFVRDFLQNLQVEDVKTKLSWKTSDFLPKLLFAGDGSLQSLLYCSHCFLAVIFLCGHSSLQSLFFAVIVLCHHCALQSWFFEVMVPCSVGNGCIRETRRKTFLK